MDARLTLKLEESQAVGLQWVLLLFYLFIYFYLKIYSLWE